MGSLKDDGLEGEPGRSQEGAVLESRLEASRRGAEERLAAIRSAMQEEIGAAPKRGFLLLLLAAGATGFAVAARRFRRRELRR